MLRRADLLAQVGVVRVFGVDPDRVGAVVELVDHPALVQRQVGLLPRFQRLPWTG